MPFVVTLKLPLIVEVAAPKLSALLSSRVTLLPLEITIEVKSLLGLASVISLPAPAVKVVVVPAPFKVKIPLWVMVPAVWSVKLPAAVEAPRIRAFVSRRFITLPLLIISVVKSFPALLRVILFALPAAKVALALPLLLVIAPL